MPSVGRGQRFFGRASFPVCPLTPVQVVGSLPLGPLTGSLSWAQALPQFRSLHFLDVWGWRHMPASCLPVTRFSKVGHSPRGN